MFSLFLLVMNITGTFTEMKAFHMGKFFYKYCLNRYKLSRHIFFYRSGIIHINVPGQLNNVKSTKTFSYSEFKSLAKC